MSQASEMEAALAQVLGILDREHNRDRPAGVLLKAAMAKLPEEVLADFRASIELLDAAIKRRNRLVHDRIEIGSSWQQGQYVPVIALLGAEEVSEESLRVELALQQEATKAAVMLLLAVDEWRRNLEPE